MATAYYCNALKNGFNAAGGEVGQGLHCALVAMIVHWDKDFWTSYENAPANYLSDGRPRVFVHKVFVVFCSIIQSQDMCLQVIFDQSNLVCEQNVRGF